MTKNELLNCFVQNLEKERLNLGMTQAEFAAKLGISVSTYKNIISRRTDKIDITIAARIYQLTGHFLYELFEKNNSEMEYLKKFRLLNERQQAYINAKIDFELEMMNHEQDSENMLDVLILTGNMEDGMVLDSANEEHVYCPEYIKKYGERLHCGIRITSNHLNPVYVRNDILGISKKPPRDGDTCILIHKPTGRAFIRKLQQGNPSRLLPINGYGDVITVDPNDPADMGQWVKFGIVIAVFRR